MAIHVTFDAEAPGQNLGFSVQRLADRLVWDFSSGTWSGSPAQPTAALPEVTSGPYAGQARHEQCLGGSPPTPGDGGLLPVDVFPDGSYAVTVHDLSAGVELGVGQTRLVAGDDAAGATASVAVSPQAIQQALDAQGYTAARAARLDALGAAPAAAPAPQAAPGKVVLRPPQSLGTDRDYRLGPLLGPSGEVPTFLGSEPLDATLWRPDAVRTAPLARPGVTWLDPAAATVTLSVNAADVAALAPGDYTVEVRCTVGSRPLGVLYATLTLLDSPVAAAAPLSTLTAVAAERELVRRATKILAAAGMDTSSSGTNPDVQPALAQALRYLGYPASYGFSVADGDLAALAADSYDEFLLLARIELYERALDRLQENYDVMIGADSLKLRQIAAGVEATIVRLRALYQSAYRSGRGRTLVAPVGSDWLQDPGSIDRWPYVAPVPPGDS